MPKITKAGGPSYAGHKDAGESAAPFPGPPDAPKSATIGHEDDYLDAEAPDSATEEESSPGISFSPSEPKHKKSSGKTQRESEVPARTMASHSALDRTGTSSARSTAGGLTS